MKTLLLMINLFIFSISFDYSSLSAKSSKKYADTVVLKNGIVLNGIRATDSIVVTTEDGATTIYKKKDISEVKKAGANNEKENKEKTEFLKSDSVSEMATVKNERIVGDQKWSGYLGIMRWDDANIQCKNLGMRLPNISELRDAFINGTTDSWKKDGLFYWSSTSGQRDHSYNIGIANGHFFIDDRIFVNDVRCIR